MLSQFCLFLKWIFVQNDGNFSSGSCRSHAHASANLNPSAKYKWPVIIQLAWPSLSWRLQLPLSILTYYSNSFDAVDLTSVILSMWPLESLGTASSFSLMRWCFQRVPTAESFPRSQGISLLIISGSKNEMAWEWALLPILIQIKWCSIQKTLLVNMRVLVNV